jgi:hypothetical protein
MFEVNTALVPAVALGTVYWRDAAGASKWAGPGDACHIPADELPGLIDRGVVALPAADAAPVAEAATAEASAGEGAPVAKPRGKA